MATDVEEAVRGSESDEPRSVPPGIPHHEEHAHLLRSVQDGRKALRRATLAIAFSAISATGAWTNFGVTIWRILNHR